MTRRKIFSEATKMIGFRVPESIKDECQKFMKKTLYKWIKLHYPEKFVDGYKPDKK